VDKSVRSSFSRFLIKPVSSDTLLHAVEQAVARHEAARGRKIRLEIVHARIARSTSHERQVFDLVVRGRMNKQIETIPSETMNALTRWEWPGNVRELENFIERSVILSEGTILNVPLSELRHAFGVRHDATLESLEREHILRVLRETGGVISGSHGAAARLGMALVRVEAGRTARAAARTTAQ
jgi:DNA-binding NtrC family response regulator